MKLSKESRRLSKQLFRSSLTAGRIDDAKVRALVASIIEGKPRHYVAVLKEYQRLVRLELQSRHAVVESAEPLSADSGGRILQQLRVVSGPAVTAEYKVNPALIGGVRVKLGSNVWDGSIQGRLTNLKEQLTKD
jgi:F-type H+-transporting ATPase subunit delta